MGNLMTSVLNIRSDLLIMLDSQMPVASAIEVEQTHHNTLLSQNNINRDYYSAGLSLVFNSEILPEIEKEPKKPTICTVLDSYAKVLDKFIENVREGKHRDDVMQEDDDDVDGYIHDFNQDALQIKTFGIAENQISHNNVESDFDGYAAGNNDAFDTFSQMEAND